MNEFATCGLYAGHFGNPIPLRSVGITGRIEAGFAELLVEQRFANDETEPIEAVYVFPLPEAAAVCGFVALVGERPIVGEVQPRETAFERYDDALAEGHGAFLLDQERPDIFTLSLGNVLAGEAISLQLRLVVPLTAEGPAWRLNIPATVAPRYVRDTAAVVGQPDGERVNAPIGATDYTLSTEIAIVGAVARVESPSHAIAMRHGADQVTVALSRVDERLDRDFVLIVEPAVPHQPAGWVGLGLDGETVAAVTFVPSVDDLPTERHGNEVIFVLDCSGSMAGSSIDQAKRALQLCLRALDQADTFNLVRFGSSHEVLWADAQPYGSPSLAEAAAWVERIDADLGGTEILEPLREVLERPLDPQRPRRVVLLTDGEVSNEAAVLALAGRHRGNGRVFSFGIGAASSQHLVNGVARASGGAAEFIHPGERIEPKVLRTFGRVTAAAVEHVEIDWGVAQVTAAPSQCPSLFPGEPVTLFARYPAGSKLPDQVTMRAGERRWQVALGGGTGSAAEPPGGLLVTAWARAALADLEAGLASGAPVVGSVQDRARPRREQEQSERRGVLERLSVRYGLVSSAASYVGVLSRPEGDKAATTPRLRPVPVELAQGWGGSMPSAATRPRGAPVAFTLSAAAPSPALPPATKPGRSSLGQQFRDRVSRHSSKASAQAVAKEAGYDGDEYGAAGVGAAGVGAAGVGAAGVGAAGVGAAGLTGDVLELLLSQQADGRFEWSDALSRWLGDRALAVRAAARAEDADLVVTAVVVELLTTEAADVEQAVWELHVAKARRWLSNEAATFDAARLLGFQT